MRKYGYGLFSKNIDARKKQHKLTGNYLQLAQKSMLSLR